jgi:Zn-dependent M28 family amino/carboxypeptidase
MGGTGSSSRAVDTIAVHHGADDNASGIALMLELAEKLSYLKGSHKRSILFIAFSGEEMGLLGSKYFADNPGIELSKVNAMINLDMVGRLQESGVLQITGAGTAEGLKEILNTNPDTTSLKLKLSDEGYGPSDHSSFYGAGCRCRRHGDFAPGPPHRRRIQTGRLACPGRRAHG